MTKSIHGVVDQSFLNRKNDYLYRLSIKCLIRNDAGQVLVVKEAGRGWWDLPGGGMDHGEDVKSAIRRELYEEVALEGDFTYRIFAVDDPIHLPNANVLQVRLIFEVIPGILPSQPGYDADEVLFIDPVLLRDSDNPVEKKVYDYTQMVANP